MLTFIIVLGLLVFVHELGHFLVAKWYRVGVLEFALGFGPKLTSFRRGETTYSLRAIPLGGFVRMVGDDPRLAREEAADAEKSVGGASPIEGSIDNLAPEQKALLQDRSRWFLTQGYVPRLAIVFAGPLFNLLFAWVLSTADFYIYGYPGEVVEQAVIGDVTTGLPAYKAGIQPGDRVLSVGGANVASWKELRDKIMESGGKPVEVILERKDAAHGVAQITVPVVPMPDGGELDILEGREPSVKPVYRIGITPSFESFPLGFFQSVYYGGMRVYIAGEMTVRLVGALVRGAIAPSKALGGPIEIFNQANASAKKGLGALLGLMVMLNVSLAILNLLPVPVLDGGHIVLFTIEKLKGKPLSLRTQEIATNIGMAMLLVLMVFALGNDIRRLFS